MIKPSEAQPKPAPKVANREEVLQNREDADAAAVLAYFARSPQKASRSPVSRRVALPLQNAREQRE